LNEIVKFCVLVRTIYDNSIVAQDVMYITGYEVYNVCRMFNLGLLY